MTYELLYLNKSFNSLYEVVGMSIKVRVVNNDGLDWYRVYELTPDEVALVAADQATNLPTIAEQQCAIARKEQETFLASITQENPPPESPTENPVITIDPDNVQDYYDAIP